MWAKYEFGILKNNALQGKHYTEYGIRNHNFQKNTQCGQTAHIRLHTSRRRQRESLPRRSCVSCRKSERMYFMSAV